MKKQVKSDHLGDRAISWSRFRAVGKILASFEKKEFKQLSDLEKSQRINSALLTLIQQTPTPCFLLPAVLDFIDQVSASQLLVNYTFSHFELWLNQFSNISADENLLVRGKIAGKRIPRDAYQALFPIGMQKSYFGSHFVTAHSSPDLDTTVASFWGWVDAFAARVSQGLHLWNVPGGPPESQPEIQLLFFDVFGKSLFAHLAKTRSALALSGIDLMSQTGLVRKQLSESMLATHPERKEGAIILVDEKGYYLGDWRSYDFEGVRQIITLFDVCLRYFAIHVHLQFISFFAKEKVRVKNLKACINALLEMRVEECEPVREFTQKQKRDLDLYLKRVFDLKKGKESSFAEVATAMKQLSLGAFQEWVNLVQELHKMPIFEPNGELIENRAQLFFALEQIVTGLGIAIKSIRTYVDTFEVGLQIKTHVLSLLPKSVNYRAEVEEIRNQMDDRSYLAVTETDAQGKLIPLGVIAATDLYKATLGTVTLRDFCNREETKIPSYFEVISVIDHHRSQLQTLSACMAIISDAQSSNVLCAEVAFTINDTYSRGGMSPVEIEKQIEQVKKESASPASKRLLKRLLKRSLVDEADKEFFIDPEREYLEYLHFLYAIFDDTDLLTKVTIRDLECVCSLLNRLKSLSLKKEVEMIHLSDIARDSDFLTVAQKRILQHPDTYSLYKKVYLERERAINENIALCVKNQPSSVFVDTKEQNRCVRVGQTKLFGCNYPIFAKHAVRLREMWHSASERYHKDKPEIDLYIQMISTIAGAEDLYKGSVNHYTHEDELWIWIPFTESSIEHLKSFLSAFRTAPSLLTQRFSALFLGDRAKDYAHIFSESFLPLQHQEQMSKGELSLTILKFKPGLLNSRKAMITPFLPKLSA